MAKKVDPCVPDQAAAQSRAGAVEAAEPLAQILGTFSELDDLQAVGREEAGIARPKEGEAELNAATDLPAPAQIADREALARIEQGQGSRDTTLADRRIGVGDGEVIDVSPELPLQPALLPRPNRLGSSSPMKPPTPCPCRVRRRS